MQPDPTTNVTFRLVGATSVLNREDLALVHRALLRYTGHLGAQTRADALARRLKDEYEQQTGRSLHTGKDLDETRSYLRHA